jgi:hypothetical protein
VYTNHVFACVWVLIGQFEETSYSNRWYQPDIDNNLEAWTVYTNSFYFIVTTMTTVGYGDMSGSTTPERVFCVILMVIGVIVFSYISGSLASVLSSYNSAAATLSE